MSGPVDRGMAMVSGENPERSLPNSSSETATPRPTCTCTHEGGWVDDDELDEVARYFLAQRCAQGFHEPSRDPLVLLRIVEMIRETGTDTARSLVPPQDRVMAVRAKDAAQ